MENYIKQEIKHRIHQEINQKISRILQDHGISQNKIQIIVAGVMTHCFLILDQELWNYKKE